MTDARPDPGVHIFPDRDTLFTQAAQRVAAILIAAQGQHGHAYLALAGGNTPKGLYRQLTQLDTAPDWQRVGFFFGDERDVPPDHADSNYRMVRESLFEPLRIGEAQVHRFHTEQAPEQALARYRQALAELPQQQGWPCFDLILLGMGSDGHIASLFPDSPLLLEQQQSVTSAEVARLGDRRYSLTLPVLRQARHRLLLVAGEDKAATLQRVFSPTGAGEALLPVQQLKPAHSEWYLDQAAASRLRSSMSP